jgi:uncharacterized protein involved in exopolysaccharide biosynthesis
MNEKTSQSEINLEEIDFISLMKKIWEQKRFIIKTAVAFVIVGILYAFLSSKEYTSEITLVPQVTDNKPKVGSSLAGLAAMAGLNLGDMSSSEVLSPMIYPKIVESVPFQKELMYAKVNFERYKEPLNLYTYYANDHYQKFNIINFIKKYTIGLPRVIIRLINGKPKEGLDSAGNHFLKLTYDEKRVSDIIKENLQLTLDEKEGYFTIVATMPEPLAAAQLAENTFVLLQQYITNFKIDKVKSNLDYIEQRYIDAKREYEAKHKELAALRDANQNVITATARTQEEKLNDEYNLLFTVYSDLAKQYEQAKIKVKETTPILTVIEPAVVPIERQRPKRVLIIIVFALVGVSAGIGLVFIKPFYFRMLNELKSA